ncbi:flagellar hook length control protein FliK [Escherichia albertii]|uniref:flagellar hook-length control protein FliK n=1 Tax=Escherichia albertii TaxID=208962 RepID=UPI0010789A1A|nr:flagellar hook-length control protein FliK [Escherichia albertii]EFA6624282.1 flagellar hook length control protein FliK [Escherichia albertii]EFA7086334.1 flagellar hook length control protein FliK [Escherichia albertii]EFF0833636.1 flagellar hook length control protein FliK [Escherichia albertii]EFF1429735.1 flagellar hook length control protein FliK [Escherichia albertii]EFL5787184.1 flagellar hook length control protein FliK [Escherichia albertii]
MIRLAPLITTDVDAAMLPGSKTTNTAQDFLALLGEALSGDTAADKTALQLPVTTDNAPIKGESLVSDILAEGKQPDLLPPVDEIPPVINNEQSITSLTTAQAITPTAAPDKDTAKKTDDLNEDVAASLNALFAMLPGFDNTPKVTATPPRALPEMKQSLTTQIHFAQSDDANDSALSTSAKSLTSLVAKARTNAEVISTPSPAVTIVSPLISSHQTQPHLTASAPVLSAPLGSHEWQQTLSQHISLFTRQGQQHAELRLHPQALGEVQISLKVDDNQAQIQMVSPHQHVRAALEAALPVLRTQLAESGIQLGQSDISGESFSNQQQATSQQQQSPHTASHERQAGEDDDELSIPASLQGRVSGNSGVDIFA